MAKLVKFISTVFLALFLYLFGAMSYYRLDYFDHTKKHRACIGVTPVTQQYRTCGDNAPAVFSALAWPLSYTAVVVSMTVDLFLPPKVVK